jgi:hypothetical protein
MIISHRHHFIFIHLPKNAGTSITAALIEYAAPEWQVRLNRMLRKVGVSFLEPVPFKPTYTAREWVSKALNRALRKTCNQFRLAPYAYWDHISTRDLIEKMGEDRYRAYFSFAIIRNPWARNLSHYNYLLQNHRHPRHKQILALGSFDAYLLKWLPANAGKGQWAAIYNDDMQPLVNYVVRYENLQSDFTEICRQIGIPSNLPHINRTRHKDYQQYYSPASKDIVAELSAKDIEIFGYTFE